jgi:Cu(I)/Ag(I) efflux system membrane fusion protein
MTTWKKTLGAGWKLLAKVPILLLLIVVFFIGYRFSTAVHRNQSPSSQAAAEPASQQTEEIWTCSMHPQIRLSQPGKCPICGMDLIRADDSPSSTPATSKTVKQPLYACSMFCLPPQPTPGKCQICGMEMVEVETEAASLDEHIPQRSLTLSPTAQRLAEIQTEPVSRQFVSAEIRMVGKVDFDETRLGYITAWVPGRLERLYVDYTGIPVKKGDHMVYLYSPELATTQTELIQAIERAKTASGRESLVGKRAEAWVEDIRDKFRLWGLTEEQISEIETRGTPSDYMTIYSPMGGIVIHKNAVEGMYVSTGTRIYTIADLSRVWVQLDAYESDLQWLRYGQEIEFQTEAYPGESFTGRIAFIDPVLDAKTRTIKVRVNVENETGLLKPGMFVRSVAHARVAQGGRVIDAELAGKWISPMHPEIVKDAPGTCDVCGMPLVRAESLGFVSVETGDAVAPLVIPATAPLITGKRALVYVAVPEQPGRFEGREIVLGPRAGDDYIVRENLTEGEMVVVHGNFKIDSAMQIVAKPSMMNPTGSGTAPGHHHGPTEDSPAKLHDKTLPPPRPEVPGNVQPMTTPSPFRAQLDKLFTIYFRIQSELSKDAHEEATQTAADFRSALADVDMGLLKNKAHELWMKEQKQLTTLVAGIAESTSIEDARFTFAMLSESMIEVAKSFAPLTRPIYRFHCPMAFNNRGADWLQVGEQTENPFFGSVMYQCGRLEETIAGNQEEVGNGAVDGRP